MKPKIEPKIERRIINSPKKTLNVNVPFCWVSLKNDVWLLTLSAKRTNESQGEITDIKH